MKRWRRILAGALGLGLAACVIVSGPAQADVSLSVDDILAAVDTADQALADGLMAGDAPAASHEARQDAVAASEIATSKAGFSDESMDGEGVALPVDLAEPIAATTSDGTAVTLTVESGDGLRDGVVASDGTTLVYRASGAGTSVAVRASQGGVRVHTIIPNARASATAAFTFGLAGDESLTLDETGFAVVKDAHGRSRAYITPAWAADANGNAVTTWYTVDGDTVTQHVDLSQERIAYPVVADPWMGFDLVDTAKWSHSSNGWTLKVTPTGWARTISILFALPTSYLAGLAGWDELYSKYKNKGLDTNLGGMKDQYICHLQFAASKSTWNLDEWRPNVSYTETVAKACNP